ncbi:acyltransferase [Quadrisphaera oryzae]|uniref:acyltransferase n=2 Tax=Quadrisphaera TaxID=317661 RepID=UPI00351C1809
MHPVSPEEMVMKRVLVACLYYGLLQHLPSSFAPIVGRHCSRARAWAVSCMAAKAGGDLDISRKVDIGLARNLSIGRGSGLGIGVELHGPVVIGTDTMISPGVLIHTRNHAMTDVRQPMKYQGYGSVRPVTIGNDVWVGARAILLPGVSIGSGAVIGAGAVVSKDVPNYAVAVGNPARVVRSRLIDGGQLSD